METTWEESEEWESSRHDNEEDTSTKTPNETPGSYHCKSALRSHDSNMKLYMYRRCFKYLSSFENTLPYDDSALLILPDLWRCFYCGTHDLCRKQDDNSSRAHSLGSFAFNRWTSTTLSEILDGDMIMRSLTSETAIWQSEPIPHDFQKKIFCPTMTSARGLLNLSYFLNLCLVLINFRYNPTRPDTKPLLPGIVQELEEDYYIVTYNNYFKVHIYLDCIRVITPIYDQILQKDIFLTICDKISERMNTIISSRIISRLSLYTNDGKASHPDGVLYTSIMAVVQWGDDLLYKKRNRAFDLLSKFEAYCVSSILRHDNPIIWDNYEFQRNLLEDDMHSQPDLYPSAVLLCDILSKMPITVLSEVHGLWRIWGHPIIDLEGGLKKMETTCLKIHNIDNRETLIGERTFKLTFSRNYFAKHHHYPISNMTSEEEFNIYQDHLKQRDIDEYNATKKHYNDNSYIYDCLRKNKYINDRGSSYAHSDWDKVIFLQNFQVPQSINLATMIKDKAISQTRSELVTSIITRNSVFDATKRRGVLKWLSEQTFRLKDYLANIDTEGLPENDRIIGLYPKERELKTKARFFSLMSYNMRMYITATEEILGKYMLPYFPMITMSDTLLNMVIRLYNMTTAIGFSDTKVVYSMNIDFSKWNQNMREKTNDGIFKNIDRLIGFRSLISRTHSIFRESYLYLCSGEYIPKIIRRVLCKLSPYSRINDESGKEGLRQKGWTITTVCDILSLAFTHGVKIELIGGGDNQVLTIEVKSAGRNLDLPYEEQMIKLRGKMERFRNSLAKKMDKRGLPLKLEETWISHRLLMYNKIMYLDGVPLPGRLKSASRLFGNSNEGICTLGNITSTLGTGYMALSAKDYTPIFSWVMSRILTAITLGQFYMCNPITCTMRLDRSILKARENISQGKSPFGNTPLYTERRNKERTRAATSHTLTFEEIYVVCLYYHKVLGGPGIGTPLSYIMKGFPDPLSECLTFNYKVLESSTSRVMKEMITNITSVNKSPIKHWEHLLEDPVSINHDAPTHGIAALREQAEQVLKAAEIKNQDFKKLISIGGTNHLRELSVKLCSSHQLEPRLLHDIVGSTVPGYVNTILSKVDQSSTLNKLSTTHDIVASVYESEMIYYMYLADKIKIKKGHTPTACGTEDARMLRNSTWDRDIIGVTTPHPAGFLRKFHHSNCDSACDQNYISILVKRDVAYYDLKRGPFRPYFGSYTSEKFKTGILASAYGDEDLLKRALKIQKLLGWRYKEGDTMYSLIQGILRCVTDSDPSKFVPVPEEITGDVEHRYHDMATKHGGIPTNLIKLFTNISCSTSTFINHSKGAANESLHFQAAIIYSSMISIIDTLPEKQTTKMFHYHEYCNTCIKPIRHPDNEQNNLTDIRLITCPTNDLMYIEERDIPIHYHNQVAFIKNQDKQTRLKVQKGDLTTFTVPDARETWLLVVAATFCIKGMRMKYSAISLIVEELSYQETIFVIWSMVIYKMISERRPYRCYTILDIEDICQDNHIITNLLIKSDILTYTATDNGIICPKSPLDYSSFISQLLTPASEPDPSFLMKASCKYQDPEFKPSKIIKLCIDNPSVKLCQTCTDIVYNIVNHPEVEADKNGCQLHGYIKNTMNYHMYSLDKVSRFKGPKTEEAVSISDSKKRKRNISLFNCIKKARGQEHKRILSYKKGSFIFSDKIENKGLYDLYKLAWSKYSVSMLGEDDSEKLNKGECAMILRNEQDTLYGDVGTIISMSQCLIFIYERARVENHIKMQDSVDITLEITISAGANQLYRKIFYLIDSYLKDQNLPKMRVQLFVGEDTELETMNIKLLQDLVISNNRSKDRTHVILQESGDQCFDVISNVSSKDTCVVTSVSSLRYIINKAYFIMDETQCYEILTGGDEATDNRAKWNIMIPDVAVSSPYHIVAEVEVSALYHQVSSTSLYNALSNHTPAYDRLLCTQISEQTLRIPNETITRQIFVDEVSISSGIVSESTFKLSITRLATSLRSFALVSHPTEKLPWKNMMTIRMIMALYVLTSNDKISAMKHYSSFYSFSYKPGTYKTILLHKKRFAIRNKDKLINWTPSSLGSDIRRVCKEMEGWLSITWHNDHELLRYISI